MYLASVYGSTLDRKRKRKGHGLCHRADPLCINPRQSVNINRNIFGWDTPADVGYSRFRGVDARDAFKPDVLDSSKTQNTVWYNLDNNNYVPKEPVKDKYQAIMGNNAKYNCNINSIAYPEVLKLHAYSINHGKFPYTNPTFAHVMYNDSVLMTQNKSRQMIFAHYRDMGTTASPASAWSFCPDDTANVARSRIHWFREVNFNTT